MREIKFRGKHITTGEWLYGSHYDDCGEEYILPNLPGSAVDYEDYQVDPNTVGQFTGLYDKNGTKIYEGDIIESGKGIRHLVRFCPEQGRFDCTLTRYVGDQDFDRTERCELSQRWIDEFGKTVIGNIHDNPELLNK